MPRLVILLSARADLGDIQDYIAKDNPIHARSFTRELIQQCRKLAALPGTLGRPRPELRADLRSFAYRGYVIFFRYDAATVEVVNIIEGHRDIGALKLG